MRSLHQGGEERLTFFAFPRAQWKRPKTSRSPTDWVRQASTSALSVPTIRETALFESGAALSSEESAPRNRQVLPPRQVGATTASKFAKVGALEVMRDFRDQPDSELSTRRCLERLVIAGTPQSVADRILDFRNEVGAFGTVLYTGHDWTDPTLARRSMELRAKEVWPRIDRGARGGSGTPNRLP